MYESRRILDRTKTQQGCKNLIALLYRVTLHLLSAIDAEEVHHWFIRCLKVAGRISRNPWGLRVSRFLITGHSKPSPAQLTPPLSFFGLPFENRVGLAAGLDKNGEAIEGLQLLDFSFIEVGTVTPLPQEGNAKPRLFRDYSRKLVFNAMGFNNVGVEDMKRSLENSQGFMRPNLILGINIGKNAATTLDKASQDYAICAKALNEQADYFTLNISSPNTKGLRGLQSVESLTPILEAVFKQSTKPVLVKLAPEIEEDSMAELITSMETQFPIAGWILTNTLQRDCPFPNSAMKVGGVSGESLVGPARNALALGLKYSKKPIISSGGIVSLQEAQLRIKMGASLVQVYSGLVFEGPSLIHELASELR